MNREVALGRTEDPSLPLAEFNQIITSHFPPSTRGTKESSQLP
jgi:hypothetical protein